MTVERRSLTNRMSGMQQRLSIFWQDRAPRERILLALAGALFLLGLLYAFLLAPAIAGRTQLEKNLPLLRQQTALMHDMSRDPIFSIKEVTPTSQVTKQTLDAMLVQKGWVAKNVSVTADKVTLSFSSVSFSGVIAWLNEVQKSSRLTLVEANFVALSQDDMVEATLTLRRPGVD